LLELSLEETPGLYASARPRWVRRQRRMAPAVATVELGEDDFPAPSDGVTVTVSGHGRERSSPSILSRYSPMSPMKSFVLERGDQRDRRSPVNGRDYFSRIEEIGNG